MAGQVGGTTHINVISQITIMGNMAMGHDPVIVANPGLPNPVGSPPVDCHKLSNVIVIAYNHIGLLIIVIQILGGMSNGDMILDYIIPANDGPAIQVDKGTYHSSVPYLHIDRKSVV